MSPKSLKNFTIPKKQKKTKSTQKKQIFQTKGPNLSYFHQSVVMFFFCFFLGFAVQSSQEDIKLFAQSHFSMKWHHIMQSPYTREYSIFLT